MPRPIYIVTGFLDSGKTQAIKRTLEDPYFTENEKTLILCFEMGDEEYDDDFLNSTNSVVEYLDFKRFGPDVVKTLDKKYKPDRLFIEFNGVDDDRELLKMEFKGFEFAQMICTIDATKFKLQVLNMPQFMFNHVSSTEIVVLNRFEGQDFRYLRTNIKSINQRAVIGLEEADGTMHDMPIENLFDPDNLNISDDDFGLFYLDVIENFMRYQDHELSFNGYLLEDNNQSLVFGRMSMVCCAQDMQRLAVKVFKYSGPKLKIDDYYTIRGVLRVAKQGNGYSIYVEANDICKCNPPLDPYVSFN